MGQGDWEEIDVRTPRQQRTLSNYGWRVWEGRSRYTAGQRVNPRGVLVFPIVVYSHSRGCSVTGGYVYRGKAVPAAKGRYFYGDFCSGTIWSLRTSRGKLTSGPAASRSGSRTSPRSARTLRRALRDLARRHGLRQAQPVERRRRTCGPCWPRAA